MPPVAIREVFLCAGAGRTGEDRRGRKRTGCKASGGRHYNMPPAGEWFDMVLSFPFCLSYPFFSTSFILSAISIAMRASPGMR